MPENGPILVAKATPPPTNTAMPSATASVSHLRRARVLRSVTVSTRSSGRAARECVPLRGRRQPWSVLLGRSGDELRPCPRQPLANCLCRAAGHLAELERVEPVQVSQDQQRAILGRDMAFEEIAEHDQLVVRFARHGSAGAAGGGGPRAAD